MPLVINGLGGGHTHIPMREPKQFQETRCAQPLAMCAWFKNVRKQVASYLAKKLLATHSTGSIGYYLCLFMQTQFQLGRYIHSCMHKRNTFSSKPTRLDLNIGRHNYR